MYIDFSVNAGCSYLRISCHTLIYILMQSVCEIQWVISVVTRKRWIILCAQIIPCNKILVNFFVDHNNNNNNNNNDKIFCANHGIIEFPTLISKFLICIIFVTYLFFLHKLFNKIICGFTVYMYVYRSGQFRSVQIRSVQISDQIRSVQFSSIQFRSVFRSDQFSDQIRSDFFQT